jgi:quinolinate synthase
MGLAYLSPCLNATATPFMSENVVMSTSQSGSLTNLLLLGRGQDLESERGVSCTGELPEASDPELVTRATIARAALGDRALVLGHHYQRDEVIAFADITGDSFKLAQAAAAQSTAEYIIFCGVHFMAESADILTSANQKVILPDLAAGCSMADMATANQVQECWKQLSEIGIAVKQFQSLI